MADKILAFTAFFVSGVALYFQYRLLSDSKFAEMYARKSPKAWLWRKLFGVEKTVELMRKVFVPVGVVISALLILAGFYLLLN